jgi:hypothetical protein
MKISHEARVKQRLTIFRIGKFLVKVALFLGILGFVFTTLNATRFGLALAGFAAVTAPFGAVLTFIFNKVGWSNNLLIDSLNQISIVLLIAAFLAINFYMGFITIYDTSYPFLLMTAVLSLASSGIFLLLGLRFSKTRV